jgi:hypothetical protein
LGIIWNLGFGFWDFPAMQGFGSGRGGFGGYIAIPFSKWYDFLK